MLPYLRALTDVDGMTEAATGPLVSERAESEHPHSRKPHLLQADDCGVLREDVLPDGAVAVFPVMCAGLLQVTSPDAYVKR